MAIGLPYVQTEAPYGKRGQAFDSAISHLADCNDHAELLKQSVALVENRRIAGLTPRTSPRTGSSPAGPYFV